MGLLQVSLVVLGASLLLYGGLRAWMWSRVRTRRLGPPRIRSADAADLPPLLRPVFGAAERELAPLGFTPVGARWIESLDVCEGPRPERIYRHPSGTLALVGPPLPGTRERPYRMTFVSRLREGPVVATFDGLTGVTRGFPPGWRCTDHEGSEPERQWELHLRSLAPMGGLEAATDTPVDAWNRLERRAWADTLREWEAVGRTRRTGDPARWRFRPFAAWRLGCRILRGQRSAFAREADAARHRARQELWRSNTETRTEDSTPSRNAARAAAMAWSYQYERAARSCRVARRSARREIAGSLAAAATCLVGLAVWLGWAVAGTVAGVLALHEAGHAAGTVWLGTDRDRDGGDAPPARKGAVALLGPAPGLLLGLVALYVFARGGGDGWLLLGVVALLVNYFNLLPILPLDGGRVVEAFLLDRYPRAQVALLGAGAAGAALAAWLFRDLVLASLALALILSVKVARTAAGALLRARAAVHRRMDESDRVLAVFETLQEPPWAELPIARRQRIAEVIVPRLGGPRVSRRAALAGAAAYAMLLLGVPAAVTTGVVVHEPAAEAAVVEEARSPTPTTAPTGIGTDRAGPGERIGARSAAHLPRALDQSSAARISEASVVGR